MSREGGGGGERGWLGRGLRLDALTTPTASHGIPPGCVEGGGKGMGSDALTTPTASRGIPPGWTMVGVGCWGQGRGLRLYTLTTHTTSRGIPPGWTRGVGGVVVGGTTPTASQYIPPG